MNSMLRFVGLDVHKARPARLHHRRRRQSARQRTVVALSMRAEPQFTDSQMVAFRIRSRGCPKGLIGNKVERQLDRLRRRRSPQESAG